MGSFEHIRGLASGWSAYEYPPGSWHWSAYGPRGGTQGKATSKTEAEDKAKRAADGLKGPGA